MANIKVDVSWSPVHDDKFIVFGSNLKLYKVETGKDVPAKLQGIKISEDKYANLLSVNSEHQYMKCVAWYPKSLPDSLIAVGLANGKVVLNSFSKGGATDQQNLIGKEFAPRHARQCNHLAWNPQEPHLLAEGLDKSRADCSFLIWNVVNSASSEYSSYGDKRHSSQGDSVVTKPLFELGQNESTSSFAWFPDQPKKIVIGMHRDLKIFDLRDGRFPLSAGTTVVHGVCIDPFSSDRLASYQENKVYVWDIRNFDKPVLTIPSISNRGILKLSWSPTRQGLLSVLPKESSVIKLYDIQSSGPDEPDSAVIERIIQPDLKETVSSYDWHMNHQNGLLSISNAGDIKYTEIFERIAVSWSPNIYMSWACGVHIDQCHSIKLCREANEDISIKMKRRAEHGYGLEMKDLKITAGLVTSDVRLRNVWLWLDYVKNLPIVKDSKPDRRLVGIGHMLMDGGRSDARMMPWQGIMGGNAPEQKSYYSEERMNAVELCGWDFKGSSSSTLDRLCAEGEYEHGAAIAVFNLQIKIAIDVLKGGARKRDVHNSSDLTIVAMALAGFTGEQNTLWKEQCKNSQLKHPYLKAMFAFLTLDTDTYVEILHPDSGISVQDKIAFASLYLSDKMLTDYLTELKTSLTNSGQLEGLLLTGLTGDCVNLLENYVDRTSDIQTACMLALQGISCVELSTDRRVHTWIQGYRDLLNRWRLWHQRSEFDVLHKSLQRVCQPLSTSSPTCMSSPSFPSSFMSGLSYMSAGMKSLTSPTLEPSTYKQPVPTTDTAQCQQVYVSCNYCNKSIAFSSGRTRQLILGTIAHRPKVTSCPSCRKPLPRCALCLINMGTASGNNVQQMKKTHNNAITESSNGCMTDFSDWFTWCQTCRHGGHASHMNEWFSAHTECPVTGCQCECVIMDSIHESRTNSENTEQTSQQT